MESEVKYVTVSIPKAIADEIDFLIGELGYWPSRSSFVRESCIKMIRDEVLRLRELGGSVEENVGRGKKKLAESVAVERERGGG